MPVGDLAMDARIERGAIIWTNCFGTADPPTAKAWGAAIAPYKGSRMFGFHPGEAFDLELSEAMTPGVPFQVSLATAVASISFSGSWYSNNPTRTRIYGSTSKCASREGAPFCDYTANCDYAALAGNFETIDQEGQLLGTTTTRPNQEAGWLYEDILFTPEKAYTHLVFVAESIIPCPGTQNVDVGGTGTTFGVSPPAEIVIPCDGGERVSLAYTKGSHDGQDIFFRDSLQPRPTTQLGYLVIDYLNSALV